MYSASLNLTYVYVYVYVQVEIYVKLTSAFNSNLLLVKLQG